MLTPSFLIPAVPSSSDSRKSSSRTAAQKKRTGGEDTIFEFVIRLISTLMDLCARETSLASADDPASPDVDLGQSVSAILRRALPALRISIRWIMSHLEHLYLRRSDAHPSATVASDFWLSFRNLFNVLVEAFPLDRLPKPDTDGELILEEDVDIKGLSAFSLSLRGIRAQTRQRAELHPNDEQLLRIADLIRSAVLISSSEVRDRLWPGDLGTFSADCPFAERPSRVQQ
jgi:hypothetical protein